MRKKLYDKSNTSIADNEIFKEEVLVEFSVLELKEEFESRLTLFNTNATPEDIEDALFYLSRIEALKIEGGFMVVYNALTIERIEQDNKKRYKAEDYQKLNQYYQNKVQQIHIVGEYARKMLNDYKDALQFVDDYFQLNYTSFLFKYFKGSRQGEIRRNITPAKFRQLFGELSPTQLKIINDNESKYIVVAAGPGSGKTRVLVHKLASLLLMEDVKHEQLLMVTFSRSAATEFKKRLMKLIGNAANYIEIKTFHSYCFDLMGRVGTLEKSDEIIQETIKKIKNALMEQNEEMRVIAVGDDDQNIFEFRGASSKYLKKLIIEQKAVMHELVENYRSKSNLVDFTNQFVKRIPHRLKDTPIIAVQGDNGKIKLVRYRSCNLIIPLVNDILSEGLAGTTCVLTKTNEEDLQITGLLVKNGMQVKLIQSNEGFSMYNLLYLNSIKTENLERVNDREIYLPPSLLAMQLTFKDVWLDYFLSCQHMIVQLHSGDELTVDGDCCRNSKGQSVLRFSKQFINFYRKWENISNKIVKEMFDKIVSDLHERGDLNPTGGSYKQMKKRVSLIIILCVSSFFLVSCALATQDDPLVITQAELTPYPTPESTATNYSEPKESANINLPTDPVPIDLQTIGTMYSAENLMINSISSSYFYWSPSAD